MLSYLMPRSRRFSILLISVLGLTYLASPDVAPSYAQVSQPNSRFFASTGYSVSGAFLSFFEANGGVNIFGYPISDQITENGKPVQYFERQRFEYHSEAAGTPYEVQLGRLGADLAGSISKTLVMPVRPSQGATYMPQTGHNLKSPFLEYWRAHGGVRILGYPISEPVMMNGILTQYFERARMEYHPETAAAGYGVELGLLGEEYLKTRLDIAAALSASAQNVSAKTTAAQSVQANLESQLTGDINNARRAAGVQQVTPDASIASIARYRSTDMATKGYFSHTPPDGRDFMTLLKEARQPFAFAGEILANNSAPQPQSAQMAFNLYMSSAPHKAIILDPRYSAVGAGEATDSQGRNYFTVIFVQR